MGFTMDKRWIYILIIFIIGVTCAYLIVESSDTVGSANININKFTVTLPSEFNIDTKKDQYLLLIDRKTQEKIEIKDLGKGNDIDSNISYELYQLKDNANVTLINDSSLKIGNETFSSIYYEKIPDYTNRITFVSKYDHLFSIDCKMFHDNQKIINDTQKIIDSIKPDYKQSQDD